MVEQAIQLAVGFERFRLRQSTLQFRQILPQLAPEGGTGKRRPDFALLSPRE
jgi:hypothetical protein